MYPFQTASSFLPSYLLHVVNTSKRRVALSADALGVDSLISTYFPRFSHGLMIRMKWGSFFILEVA